MKISALWLGLALTTNISVALAHAHLQKSMPADGSVVTETPKEVVLTFSEAARLTAAWIQKGDGVKEKLGSLPASSASVLKVTLPALMPGTYVLSWRAISDDGHVMPGQIHFTVGTGSKEGQSTASPPPQH